MSSHDWRVGGIALAAFLWATTLQAHADEAAPAAESATDKAFAAAREVAVHGPAHIPWIGQASLQLPEGYIYVPRPAADGIMDAYGNSHDERFLGLVFPAGDANWFVVAEYEDSGYIKDDDASHWDVDELLASLKEGTEAQNERRRELGISELKIVGWTEKPVYDAATHRLVWSVAAHDTGSGPGDAQTINYNTYMLGREGYITMNLVTASDAIATDKADAHKLLGALSFNPGKTYADFNESTDKVAAYGLAALVAGVAAKKLGLFAVIAAFVAKFAKVFLIAAAAGGAALWKRLRGKAA
ncbi:MAG: DUF2167 domain-containing protein [Steroidobacteraceae bacterium]